MPCQVPRFKRPSVMGMVMLTPLSVDLAWAGISSAPSNVCSYSEAIEDGFHIDANIRVAVLVDAQSATGMFREDGHDARLRQFRQLTHYLARHQMEATTFRLQGYFNLLYHTGCKGTNKNRYVEISLLSFRENPPPDYDFSFVNTEKNAVLCTEKKK